MGVVYRGRDPRIGRAVAIKLMRAADETLRERFLQEAQSAGSLKHRNIVTIFDYGEHDGQSYIVMEFVEGITLADQIRHNVALPLWRKLEVMDEVAAGLEHAHNKGVVHRDIKPANVMTDRDGIVKILDFGVARLANSSMTQAGLMLGTPNYMSPEQVKACHVDRRSDIFAVGLLFYELLTYRQAFSGDTPWDIMNAIVHGTPTPLRELWPDVDPAIEAIVSRAIEKDPAKRYQTLATLGADLARVRSRIGARIPPASPTSVTVLTPLPGPPPRTPPPRTLPPRTLRSTADRELLSKRRAERIDLYLLEARRAFDAGHYAEALEAGEQALMLDADEPRALDVITHARSALDRIQALARLAEARECLDRNDLDEAMALIEHAAALGPLSSDALSLRAAITERAQQRDAERQRYQAVLDGLARARASFASGQFESAIRAASEVLIHEPANEEAHQLSRQAVAEIQVRNQKLLEADAAREAIAEQQREFAAGRPHEAIASLERYSPAHELITAAVAQMRDELADLDRRSREAEERQRREEAEEAARRSEEISQRLARATTEVERGNLADARALVESALAIDSQHAEALLALHDIDAAIEADQRRRAHARAAEEAAAAARRRFEAGQRSAALALLESFTPPHEITTRAFEELKSRLAEIEEQRRELARQRREATRQRRAAVQQATARAEAAVARDAFGDAMQALDEADRLARPTAARKALRGRAVAGMEAARQRAEHDRMAQAAVEAARERAALEDWTGAETQLEAFAPSHPLVSQALIEVRQELAAQAERVRREQEDAERRAEADRARLLRVDEQCRIAQTELAAGNFDRAVQRLQQTSSADGPAPGLDTALADALAQQAAAAARARRQREVLRLVAEAHGKIVADDLSAAAERLEAALTIDPGHAGAVAAMAALRALQEEALPADEDTQLDGAMVAPDIGVGAGTVASTPTTIDVPPVDFEEPPADAEEPPAPVARFAPTSVVVYLFTAAAITALLLASRVSC